MFKFQISGCLDFLYQGLTLNSVLKKNHFLLLYKKRIIGQCAILSSGMTFFFTYHSHKWQKMHLGLEHSQKYGVSKIFVSTFFLLKKIKLVSARVFSRGVKLKKTKLLWFRAPLGGSQNWNPMVKRCSKKYFIQAKQLQVCLIHVDSHVIFQIDGCEQLATRSTVLQNSKKLCIFG